MTFHPASFWLGFSVAFIAIGVVALAAAWLFRRELKIAPIDKLDPRRYPDEHDAPRFV